MRTRPTHTPRRAVPPRGRSNAHTTARQPVNPARDRAREAGGPQDRALYSCGCGSTFLAPVSASVTCRCCGAQQAW